MIPSRATELEIYALATGGRGLARARDGRVVLVEGALPGERVYARLVREHRSWLEAACLEVVTPSPRRVEPACPYFGSCGGCDLMHLEHAAQLEAKVTWLREALRRLEPPGPEVLAPLPPWGRRNRLRLQLREGRVGFFARRSHRLVEVRGCAVAAAGIDRVLKALTRPLPEGGRWLELLAGEEDGGVWACLGLEEGVSPRQAEALVEALSAAGVRGVRVAGRRWACDQDHGLCYHRGGGGLELWAFPGLFCQVGFAANRLLLEWLQAQVGAGEGRPALDLYAGSGNLGLTLAAAGWRVTAVERARGAGEAFAWQAARAGLSGRVGFRGRDAARAVAELAGEGARFPLVVLDPPRAGAKGVMEGVVHLEPEVVVYVSCHPAALGRDAAVLAGAGYSPRGLALVDMFPHTGQVEAALVMRRGAQGA